jgi:hypothetical protein
MGVVCEGAAVVLTVNVNQFRRRLPQIGGSNGFTVDSRDGSPRTAYFPREQQFIFSDIKKRGDYCLFRAAAYNIL